MLKRRHPEFPSDIFVLLETVAAMIAVEDSKCLPEKNVNWTVSISGNKEFYAISDCNTVIEER